MIIILKGKINFISRKTPEIIQFGFAAMLLLVFYLLNVYTPLNFKDDLTYALSLASHEKLSSFNDIFQSLKVHFNTQNGRLVVHFLAQTFLMAGKPLFNLVNTFAFFLLGFLICLHGSGKLSSRTLPLIIIVFSAFILYTPYFAEDFLWLTGASNYLFSADIVLLYLLPYRLVLAVPDKINGKTSNIILLILMLIFGFIAGNTIENASLGLIAAVVIFLIVFRLRNIKYRLWMFSPTPVLGLLTIFLAPGERSRIAGSVSLNIIGMVKNAAITGVAFVVHFYPFIFIIALIIYFYCKNTSSKKEKTLKSIFIDWTLPLIYLFPFLASTFSLMVVDGGIGMYSRVWLIPMVFLVIIILNSYNDVILLPSEHSPHISSRAKLAFVSLVAIISIAVSLQGLINVKGRYSEYLTREVLINEQISSGCDTVSIPIISSSSHFSIYYCGGEAIEYGTGVNKPAALYFGVSHVIRDDRIPLH